MNLEFWDFEEWANRANVFPVFPDWSKGCLNNVCTRYTLESGSRSVQDFEVAGCFIPVSAYACTGLEYYVIHNRGIWFALNRVYSVITK